MIPSLEELMEKGGEDRGSKSRPSKLSVTIIVMEALHYDRITHKVLLRNTRRAKSSSSMYILRVLRFFHSTFHQNEPR